MNATIIQSEKIVQLNKKLDKIHNLQNKLLKIQKLLQ